VVHWAAISAIGLVVGFLAGMFGKGGSAIATPMLAAVGVPPIVAVAAPLPATIPSTVAAGTAYWRVHLLDRRVLWWSLGFGVPATVAGALLTVWISGGLLVKATDVLVAALGLRFLLFPEPSHEGEAPPSHYRLRLALVAVIVGLASGLLANSGGFLLAPLYIAVLAQPIKTAFGTSLAAAAVLAVPGTVVHAALGHIDWAVVAVFGLTSVPLSFLGARVALRMNARRLERVYGAALTVLGVGLLVAR
jgi:uncharacterized membrane protein YfcA